MHLMVDDVKHFSGMDLIACNYDSALKVLTSLHVTHLYLDYDLQDNFDRTGLDLLKELFDKSIVPKNIQLISGLQESQEMMSKFLSSKGFKNKEGWWTK